MKTYSLDYNTEHTTYREAVKSLIDHIRKDNKCSCDITKMKSDHVSGNRKELTATVECVCL